MRMNESRMIINENLKALVCNLENDNINQQIKGMKNISIMMDAVNAIGNIPCFSNLANEIRQLSNISSIRSNDLMWIPSPQATNFRNKIALLYQQASAVLQFINSTIPLMDKDTICVKLPANLTATELKTIIDSFALAFDTITKSEDRKDEVKLVGVESGSEWLSFLCIGEASILIIKEFIKSALDIYEKFLSIKKLRLELRKLEIEVGSENDMETARKNAIEKQLLEIQGNTKISLEGEWHNKYFQALNCLVKILETKTTIYPAITAPKEITEPHFKRLAEIDSLTNNIQLLEAATVSDDSMESAKDNQEQKDEKDSES